MRPLVRRVLSFALLAEAACGSSGGGPGGGVGGGNASLAFTGTEGVPIAVTNVSDTLVVPLAANGARGTAILDTGSPILALDLTAFPGAGLPSGSGTLDTLTLGAMTVDRATVVGANLIVSPDPTVPIGGSLGCAVICSFGVALNYRDTEVTFGKGTAPANVESPGTVVPFDLLGGGSVTITGVPGVVSFPVSRISLSANVEGTSYAFVVDTGDSFVTLRQTLFGDIVADGRAQIGGIGTATVGQSSTSSVTRLRSFSVGGVSTSGIVASEDSTIEATLDAVAMEVGHPIDGLVGGSFLRQFFVAIDYAGSTLTLARYTVGAPTFDAFDRVGIAITPPGTSGHALVSGVVAGTDAAAKGVSMGDEIVAVDGQPLASLGATKIDVLLSGDVGSSKSVQFGTAASASLANKTVAILVNDLLPL